MRKMFIIVLCCVAVLLAGYAGYRGYKVWKNKHLMSLGHDFLAKSDRRNAVLSVQEVLRSDPTNLDATRMMAQLAEASRSPAALMWRSRVVELDPHSLEDRLALAQTALTMRDYATATNALEGVDAADKETAAYHNIAGTVAAAANQPDEAEAHFLEASRLEPQNPAPQLNLAVVRLHGTNALELAEARTALQRLASNPTNSDLRCQALRELTLDAMGHKHDGRGSGALQAIDPGNQFRLSRTGFCGWRCCWRPRMRISNRHWPTFNAKPRRIKARFMSWPHGRWRKLRRRDALAWLRSSSHEHADQPAGDTSGRRVLHGVERLDADSMPGLKNRIGPKWSSFATPS